MSTSSPAPAPGSGPEPAPHTPTLSGGGGDDDYSPLLDLLEKFPDLFHKEVLERLDPTARISLAGAGSVFRDVVFPISIFPLGLPPGGGGGDVTTRRRRKRRRTGQELGNRSKFQGNLSHLVPDPSYIITEVLK
jgi:hypothetical protein